VKKLRHSWLFAALTIMLGVAVLSSTMAAPAMRVVLGTPTAVLDQSVSGARLSQSAAEIAAAQAGGSGGAAPAPQPPLEILLGSNSVTSQTYVPGNRPTLFGVEDTVGGDWMADYIVDVFSNADGDATWRNSDIDNIVVDPAYKDVHDQVSGKTIRDVLPDTNTKLLYPGVTGNYKFTLKNPESFPIEWRLTITDENVKKIPMRYRLLKGAEYLVGDDVGAGSWVDIPATGIIYPPAADDMKVLSAMASEPEFTLEWKWEYLEDDDQDEADTKLGEDAGSFVRELMPYYRLNFLVNAEAADEIEDEKYVIIWYYTDPITGELIEWDRWEINKEDLGKTIRELIDIYGFAGMPPDPKIPGFRFLGWRDKDGVDIDENYVVEEDKFVMGANGLELELQLMGRFNSTGSNTLPPWKRPKALLPLLALIPVAGLLPLIPLMALLPLLPLIPAALLLPFLPGWIARLIPDRCDDCHQWKCKCDEPPEEGYVKPPKTGDILYDLAPVYLLLAVSTGLTLLTVKKRKKDEQNA